MVPKVTPDLGLAGALPCGSLSPLTQAQVYNFRLKKKPEEEKQPFMEAVSPNLTLDPISAGSEKQTALLLRSLTNPHPLSAGQERSATTRERFLFNGPADLPW